MGGSNIPKARDHLLVALDLLDCLDLDIEPRPSPADIADWIMQALNLMRRRPAARRAPQKHAALTSAQRIAVRAYIAAHPNTHISEVAQIFGVNQGRISECLTSKK